MSATFSVVLSNKTSIPQVIDAKTVVVEVDYRPSDKCDQTIKGGAVEFVI